MGVEQITRRVVAAIVKADPAPKAIESAAKRGLEGDRLHLSAGARQAVRQPVSLEREAVAALDRRLEAMAGLNDTERAALAAFHAPVWADPALQERAHKVLSGWVWGGKGKVELIAAYRRVVVEGQAPASEAEHVLTAMLATRRARWERLAAIAGVPVPDTFHLHRGVRGDYAVEAVVKAWSDEGATHMAVPSHALASWSLDPTIARAFGDDKAASVFYEAQIPFEQTLADKWVDGSAFVALALEQQEVVVAGAEGALSLPKQAATVLFEGKTYTYDRRQELIRAWRARKPLKVA